jgi:hypothetical protein
MSMSLSRETTAAVVDIAIRAAVVLIVMSWLTESEDSDARALRSLNARIIFWRKVAERCGKRVIDLEKRYYDLADAQRMN